MNGSPRAGHALRSSYQVFEEEPVAEQAEAGEAASGHDVVPLILTVDIETMARAYRLAAFAGLLSRWLRRKRR